MSSSSTSLQPFALRLVSIDYYLAKPAPKVDVSYAPLEGTSIEQVPVVRIFGSTPAGQKACVHLHKVCLAMTLQIYQEIVASTVIWCCRHFHTSMFRMMTASLMSLLKVCMPI